LTSRRPEAGTGPSADVVITTVPYGAAAALVGALLLAGCGPKRLEVVGPIQGPERVVESLERSTRLTEPTRIDFTWRLNEAGDRLSGVGVARVEPPYRARLDLFLNNYESVISAALVDDELRLPPGARGDILPPTDLMWATLGVFRPVAGTELLGAERLEGGARRLRYAYVDGAELQFELLDDFLRALEVVHGGSVVEWVRLEPSEDGRYPRSATYRNVVDFRELEITRTKVRSSEPFEPSIWDPRG
jgi:hypothetical protein